MIKTVTITGADDSVNPRDLIELSREFPFVEWGILLSRKRIGSYRYPSGGWLDDLCHVNETKHTMNLSLHICGAYAREFAKGNMDFIDMELAGIWHIFNRVQINLHGEHDDWNTFVVSDFLKATNKEFIFQHDSVSENLLKIISRLGVINASVLFDGAGGRGKLPNNWPKYLDFVKCGYAGGLGHDNLAIQIEKILKASQPNDTWIDMETKVRSVNDSRFDLDKVRKCLEIAKPYVK